MEQAYAIVKSFVDPVFIIFVLLFICFIICFVSQKKKGSALFLLFALILFYGSSIHAVSNYLTYQLEKPFIQVAPVEGTETLDVIVVLSGGAQHIKTTDKLYASEATIARLAHAVRMFKMHHAKYLVCSGNVASGTELMAEMAVDFGVPKDRIRIESKSRNTYEHAVEFNRIFVDKNIKVGLVTSGYHMRRSEKEFKKFFTHVTPLASDYQYASPSGTVALRFLPQSQGLCHNAIILREYVGQIWYSIKDI